MVETQTDSRTFAFLSKNQPFSQNIMHNTKRQFIKDTSQSPSPQQKVRKTVRHSAQNLNHPEGLATILPELGDERLQRTGQRVDHETGGLLARPRHPADHGDLGGQDGGTGGGAGVDPQPAAHRPQEVRPAHLRARHQLQPARGLHLERGLRALLHAGVLAQHEQPQEEQHPPDQHLREQAQRQLGAGPVEADAARGGRQAARPVRARLRAARLAAGPRHRGQVAHSCQPARLLQPQLLRAARLRHHARRRRPLLAHRGQLQPADVQRLPHRRTRQAENGRGDRRHHRSGPD